MKYGTETAARGAVAPLAAATKDPDPRVRAAAAVALGDIGTESHVAVPDLVALFHDPVVDVRRAALGAFPHVGSVPGESRGALVGLLRDPDRRVRVAAARAIVGDDLAADLIVAGLLGALKDPDPAVRAAAAGRLEQAPITMQWRDLPALVHSPTAGAALRSALADPDPRVRAAAAHLLPLFRREAAASIPLLTARLKDPEVIVRSAAAGALSQFGAGAKTAVPALLDALAPPDPNSVRDLEVSAKAAEALEAIGPDAKAAMLDRLTAQLGDPDERVRFAPRRALGSLREKVFPSLFHVLADPKTPRTIQVEILNILADSVNLGDFADWSDENPPSPEARAAVPSLRVLARDDPDAHSNALKLLAAIERGDDIVAELYLDAVREEGAEGRGTDSLREALKTAMIPALIRGLTDPDAEVRMEVARALRELAHKLRHEEWSDGEQPDPAWLAARARDLRLREQAVEALVPFLKDPDARVRWNAALALGACRAGAKPALPALIAMLKSESGRVRTDPRMQFNTVNGQSGDVVYLPGRNDRGDKVAIAAILALGMIGPEATAAVPELVRALRDDDPRVRWFAAGALASIGPGAKASVPALIEALRSKDVATGGEVTFWNGAMSREDGPIRLAAAVALGRIGPESRAAVPDLVRALRDPDARVRSETAQALGAIGPAAGAAVAELVRMMSRDADDEVADLAAEALGRIGAAAVPAVSEILRGRDPDARIRAVKALGAAGPKAAAATADLLRALGDRDEELRTAAAAALGRIGHGPEAKAAIPALIAALKDPDWKVRQHAAVALGQIGPMTDRVIAALIVGLKDPEEAVALRASDALTLIGTSALPPVLALLRDEDRAVRQSAIGTLVDFGRAAHTPGDETEAHARERAAAARAALRSALGDRDERVRFGASEALRRLGKEAVPDLIAALGDPSAATRLGAAQTLGAIGGEARAALDALRRRRDDPDPAVHQAVDTAIRAISESGAPTPWGGGPIPGIPPEGSVTDRAGAGRARPAATGNGRRARTCVASGPRRPHLQDSGIARSRPSRSTAPAPPRGRVVRSGHRSGLPPNRSR